MRGRGGADGPRLVLPARSAGRGGHRPRHRGPPYRRRRKIRDLPVSGRRVTLVWIRRRFVCANCDERHLDQHDEFEGALTRRLARQLVADAKDMSIRAVVRRHGLDWHLIQALVTSWSATVAEHRRSRRCRVLL
ncbi:MAG: transposase family protein, partial [Hyphomicrobiales bacterium]|nr:transposase family protein [Hyphomicrobiales bacterium]